MMNEVIEWLRCEDAVRLCSTWKPGFSDDICRGRNDDRSRALRRSDVLAAFIAMLILREKGPADRRLI